MARDAKVNSKETAIALAWVLVPHEEWWVLCSVVPASTMPDEANRVIPTQERLQSLSQMHGKVWERGGVWLATNQNWWRFLLMLQAKADKKSKPPTR